MVLFIFIGNVLIFGKGYVEGFFIFEVELCEMVDYVEVFDFIEVGEWEMIYLVFELGDIFMKEVMVLCIDVVYIFWIKNLC